MSDTVRVFKALSDGTRLRILNILLERECCVCEVMQVLGISQPSASRHLSILHDAGLLKAKKQGIWMNYAVDPGDMPAYAQEILKGSGWPWRRCRRPGRTGKNCKKLSNKTLPVSLDMRAW